MESLMDKSVPERCMPEEMKKRQNIECKKKTRGKRYNGQEK